MATRERRISHNQALLLIEGAEMMSQATGLSVTEIVRLVLGEPVEREEAADEPEPKPRLATGA